jgi:hypothetical protein
MTTRGRVLTALALAGVVAVSSALPAGGKGTWFFHTTRS